MGALGVDCVKVRDGSGAGSERQPLLRKGRGDSGMRRLSCRAADVLVCVSRAFRWPLAAMVTMVKATGRVASERYMSDFLGNWSALSALLQAADFAVFTADKGQQAKYLPAKEVCGCE